VTNDRRYVDDLPTISISRLRAEGVITAETTEFVVRLGDVEETVGVKARRFPNGGSWSSFVSPCCGVQVRVLKLLNGRLLCSRCCRARGMLYRSDPTSPRRRAALRIPKLRAMLESDKPLRLKPSTMRGKMERRERHEAALQRNLLILRRHELVEFERAMTKVKE
jgi:hypothetical protein